MPKKLEDMVGKVYQTNSGADCVVVEYRGSTNVKVRFLDKFGYEMNTCLSSLRAGKVKNPFAPKVFGVGYLGEGRHKPSINGVKQPAYVQWHSMIRRGYDEDYKDENPSCVQSYVCEEWHCFDTYADWFYQQKGWDKKFQLDKDIKGDGTQKYSPSTCCLVPPIINTMFNDNKFRDNGLPLGVSIDSWSKDFLVVISKRGKLSRIGVYKDVKEAFKVYKSERESYIKEVANEWKEYLDDDVFDIIYNTEVGESGCLSKEESAFKFFDTGEVIIPKYYQDNLHKVYSEL